MVVFMLFLLTGEQILYFFNLSVIICNVTKDGQKNYHSSAFTDKGIANMPTYFRVGHIPADSIY